MNDLFKPIARAWNYFGTVGGFPGQVFFVVAVIIVVFGVLTWYGNRK